MSDGNSSIVITDRHSTLIALLLLEWQSVKLYRDEIIKHISTDQPINWKPGGSAHRIQAALHPIQLFKSVNHNVISNWPLWGSWVSLYARLFMPQSKVSNSKTENPPTWGCLTVSLLLLKVLDSHQGAEQYWHQFGCFSGRFGNVNPIHIFILLRFPGENCTSSITNCMLKR